MFKVLNDNIKFPELYPSVERKLDTVNEKGWDRVGNHTLRDKIDFIPQQGLQENFCRCESNLIFMTGSMGMGKAQPYDAKILTPCGYKEMGSLKIGQTITGADGKQQTILQIFEQGERDVCEFSFADGAKVECDYEHLWDVNITTINNKPIRGIFTAKGIIEYLDSKDGKYGSPRHIRVPLPNPIEYSIEEELPIDAYTLGAIIANGCMRTGSGKLRIYTKDYDVLTRIKNSGHSLSSIKNDEIGYTFDDAECKEALMNMGLWDCLSYDKFIPENYLKASVEDRFALLKGLMDCDGSAIGSSTAEYSTSSKRLADDVRQLILSLGGNCRISSRIPKYTYKRQRLNGHISYRVYISMPNQKMIFGLSRKKNKCLEARNKLFDKGREIVGYKHIGRKQCRCLLVSNPDHLYITNDFVVTHNTYAFNIRQLYGVDHPGYSGVMISVRLQDSSKGSSIFRDANEVFGSFASCDVITSGYPTFAWPQWNSSVRLIHSNFNAELPSEWEMFKDYAKKVQASYIAIDEATQIKSFKMFTYWFGRNRDSSGLTPTMALSFNPDHDHWTTQMLRDAGCLTEDWYLRKDMNGVTKYFYVKGETPESIIWGDTPEEVIERAGITLTKRDIAAGATAKDMVKSFTMFTGETADNRKLMSATKGGMLGNLHAMGGVQRDINKGAYFGPVEKDELSVNRTMIHSLWENPISEDQNMYATLDVSGGNTDSDNCPMCIFKGNSLVAIDMFHGSPKELVTWIERNLNKYNIPVSNFAFDATGIGNYLRAFTSGVPLTANRRPIQELDAQGNPINLDVYFNLRSQLLSRLEVMFQKGELNFSIPKDMTIPYGKKGEYRRVLDILFDEMNVLSFTTRNNKRYARSKEEYKNKYKCSPDLLDSIMLFMFFFLDAKPKKQPKPMVEEDAYDEIFAPHPLVGWGYY